MNLKRCDRKHYYDADKFVSCPHCASGYGELEETAAIYPDDDMETEELTNPPQIAQKGSSVPMAGSLAETVNQVRDSITVEDDIVTVSYYETKSGLEPVVGWLVCIEGDEVGASFELKSGRNFIGRSTKMDVVIKDHSVSRDKHAVVLYEPKKREFLAQPGESRELFYLNNEVVLNFEKLKAYDVIQVGNTKLMFMPFCSETFCWDDIKSNVE